MTRQTDSLMHPTSLIVEAGLLAEQDLLASVCSGESEFGLLFWQPSDKALVMPRRLSRLPGFEAACDASAAAGWPVLLRETGGEPVPQSASTINIALVYAPPAREGDLNRIETAYRRLCDPICQLLDELGGVSSLGEVDGAFCDGRFNVNLDGRKMVGTAQRWRQSKGGTRPVGLVHGALLLDNERESMVAAVNRFNEACGLDQRVRAESHIALHEKFTAPDALERLDTLYRQLLAEVVAA
ncbi:MULTISPECIES: lipoate--protein ligase family protein [unclassified Pseudomonas]|uniref:lipoate--protein ligase family protein n=1 Tax=unclassified Pseudomonas TaxID=196821 RepID=UPI001391775C|nr:MULTISPECIES: lipoate--protein ligase family protein [unclassified Pseudomonas]KAI2693964.1 lipoate--protein ligase family protein [Pseudomonas sp. TNT3]MBF4560239.1 lipoate--protein ligase family protein [Pseudomonas sp. p50(2008)]MBH1968840.1 lipoate--protein ligase family protein [Pseudomonadales bacterium]MBH2079738.1 lipoate--protein ligase family protein [Pseudomonadales bacterium]